MWCTASRAECPCTYIGQMGRSLDHLLHEHYRALKTGDLGSSALAEHVFSSNHQVDLSKAIVIDTHNHTQTHCMLESYIEHPAPSVPTQQGEGHFARTLCCTTGLTVHPSVSSHYCVVTIINIYLLLFFFIYLFIFL